MKNIERIRAMDAEQLAGFLVENGAPVPTEFCDIVCTGEDCERCGFWGEAGDKGAWKLWLEKDDGEPGPPDCSKELDARIEEAKLRRIKPPIANTSEGSGIRKMVPLDNVKRCADLCIDMGWTLQEFRKNMDEWDEDTVDITETE